MRTKYEINDVVRYAPAGSCLEVEFSWLVKVLRNGWLFVTVQDLTTGYVTDVLRWDIKRL